MSHKINFDDYADDYNQILANQLQFFDASSDYFSEYKVLKTKQLLRFEPQRILDYGCGIGRSTVFLRKHFPAAHVVGCDISEKSLQAARETITDVDFLTLDQAAQGKFDLIFLAGVLHHVEPRQHQAVFAELVAMSESGTQLVIFEHNPWNPLTRHLVNTCPFDKDAVLLRASYLRSLFKHAGFQQVRSDYTLFFPGKLKWLRWLEQYLSAIPFGGQYVVSGSLP